MKNLTIEQEAKLQDAFQAMAESRKVKAVDTADGQLKESDIVAIYADYTVMLSDLIASEVNIDLITFE